MHNTILWTIIQEGVILSKNGSHLCSTHLTLGTVLLKYLLNCHNICRNILIISWHANVTQVTNMVQEGISKNDNILTTKRM